MHSIKGDFKAILGWSEVEVSCLSPNPAFGKTGLRLPDQRCRFRELQISSDAGGFWGQQATVVR
jgi:hypothetical protein